MSYDVVLKRGDTRNALQAILKDTTGNPVNLEGCSVNFHMAPFNRTAVVSRAVHIQDAATGEVWVVWVPGRPRPYRAEFEVIYEDGRRETFPNTGYIVLKIIDDLG